MEESPLCTLGWLQVEGYDVWGSFPHCTAAQGAGRDTDGTRLATAPWLLGQGCGQVCVGGAHYTDLSSCANV